jgi:small-conductance mechanosensitive channel
VSSDINCEIVRKFQRNGVEIPFPQRDLHVRSPLPLPVAPGNEARSA